MHSAAAPASAPGVATPSGFRRPRRWHWLPRHPAHTGPPRSSGPGVSARSLPAPPTGGTRSLTGFRRCPRSMTPGTAAAPAPGCWPRLLRPAADGGALRKLRRVGSRSGKAADEGRSGQQQQAGLLCPSAAAAAPAHNQSLYAVSGDVDSTAYNAGLCAIALQGQQHLQVTGYGWHRAAASPAPSGAARSCCTLLQQHGPGWWPWWAASRPQPGHGAGRARPAAKQGGPPARAPAPAHPAQRRRGLGRVGLRRPGPASRRSPARAIKPA